MSGKADQTPRYLGARVTRREDPRMVTGRARYVDDLTPPGTLHLRFVRAEIAHGRITGLDTEALFDRFPDALIFTGEDIGDLSLRAVQDHQGVQASAQPLLARDRVRFVGEPVAAVLLDDPYEVEDAAELVFVDYDPLPVLADVAGALSSDAPLMHDGWTSNLFVERATEGGDIEAARKAAVHTVKRTYRTHRQAGCPMECRGVVAEVDATGELLTVRSSTQMPHLLRTTIAEALDYPESLIRVAAPEVGGGFGVKGHVFVEEILTAWLALKIQRPVKWIEDRREHLIASIHAREHEHTLEAYLDAEGRILGLRADITVDVGAYSVWPFTASSDPGMVAKVLPGPYVIPAYQAVFRGVATNKCPIGTYRGVGRPSAVFSQERLMDEIAREIGLDPFELRLRNVVREFPYKNVLGITYDEGSYAQSLERMRELLAEDLAAAGSSREGRIRLGVGFALFHEQSAHGTADFAKRRTEIETGYQSARIEIGPDGRATVFVGLQSHGQGLETTLAQVAAARLGLRVEDVRVVHGDTATSPYSVGTWGSRGGALGGGAVHMAAGALGEKLTRIAAVHLQAEPGEVELAAGEARLRGRPGNGIPIRDLARWANRTVERLPEGMAPGLAAQAFCDGPPDGTYSNACHAAVVEIDTETGRLTLKRFVVVEDCGTILNPMIVDGQVRGGVAQGIGSALLEQFAYDGQAQPLTTNLADYLMPSATDIPDIEVHHIETPTPLTPLGAKGLGEGGAIGPAAAIANAVSDALGVEVRETPLGLNAVWTLANLHTR